MGYLAKPQETVAGFVPELLPCGEAVELKHSSQTVRGTRLYPGARSILPRIRVSSR